MAAWESSTEKWLKLWWTWRKLYGLTFLHFSLANNEFIEPICGEKPVTRIFYPWTDATPRPTLNQDTMRHLKNYENTHYWLLNAIDRWMATAICKTPLWNRERNHHLVRNVTLNFLSLVQYVAVCHHQTYLLWQKLCSPLKSGGFLWHFWVHQ